MYLYITSMSETKSKVYDKLTVHVTELVKHIMKISMYPQGPIDHWKVEIYALVNWCPKLKGKNKLPDSKFIFQCLSVSNDIIPNLVRQVIAEESHLTPQRIEISELVKIAELYEKWLAEKLSRYGVVTKPEVYSILDEIIQSV